jgi:hypothetical protein
MLPLAGVSLLIALFSSKKSKNDFLTFIKKYKLISVLIVLVVLWYIINKAQHVIIEEYFNQGSLFTIHTEFALFMGLPFFILFVLSAFTSIIKPENKNQLNLLLSILIFLILLTFLNTKFGTSLRYVTFLVPLISIAAVYSISHLISIKNNLSNIIFIIVLALIIMAPTYNYFQGDNHFLTKQKYTWARPDYRVWKDVNIPNSALLISNTPHIARFYTGRIDYSMDITAEENIDPKTGVQVIKDLSNFKDNCTFIFADYRKHYMWDEDIFNDVQSNYYVENRSRQVRVYKSKNCN